jgi:hypothetical protein
MKTYPSIPRSKGSEGMLYTFDKIDGSNLRFEWSKKKGWHKFGTRRRLFDESDEIFGVAIPIFHNSLAEPLERTIRDQGWDNATVFVEFWGENSFAGCHKEQDEKFLTLIDVSIYKKGIINPKDFLKLFGEYGPEYLGLLKWNKSFIENVSNSNIDGITFEGVVGKVMINKRIVMVKAKTNAWKDKVREKFGDQADKIIES